MLRRVSVAVVGDFGCGKTSIMVRAAEIQSLTNNRDPLPCVQFTVGIDFMMLDFPDQRIQLQLWDTAGQERFQMLSDLCYRRCSIIVIVYDVTKRKTFDRVDQFMKQVWDNRDPKSDTTSLFLVANKIDLDSEDRRQVSSADGAQKATSMNAYYFETSAQYNFRWTVGVLAKCVADEADRQMLSLDDVDLDDDEKEGTLSISSSSSSSKQSNFFIKRIQQWKC